MAKKQTAFSVQSLRCGHCDADGAKLKTIQDDSVRFFCGIDCTRAFHRDQCAPNMRQYLSMMTEMMIMVKDGVMKGFETKEHYRTLWSSRAAIQSLLDRDDKAYYLYKKKAEELWCERLESATNDKEVTFIAECMKDWHDACEKYAPAFLNTPYRVKEIF